MCHSINRARDQFQFYVTQGSCAAAFKCSKCFLFLFFLRRSSAKLLQLRLMMAWLCNPPVKKKTKKKPKRTPTSNQGLSFKHCCYCSRSLPSMQASSPPPGQQPAACGGASAGSPRPSLPGRRAMHVGTPGCSGRLQRFCGSAPKKTHRQQMACVVFRPAMRLYVGSGSPKPAPLSL